jgi:hypothetical protein
MLNEDVGADAPDVPATADPDPSDLPGEAPEYTTVEDEIAASAGDFNGWFVNPSRMTEARLPKETRKAMVKTRVGKEVGSTGIILWEGKSPWASDDPDDEQPIVVILTFGSSNVKTGNMHSTHIIRADMDPQTACSLGKDQAICGNCILRPQHAKERRKTEQGDPHGECYVRKDTGEGRVYAKYAQGGYPPYDPAKHDALLQNSLIRWGTYGDPAFIPLEIVEHLSSLAYAWTGYTHQWKEPYANDYKRFLMASINYPNEYEEAKADGWRTFRVRQLDEPLLAGEIVCPASIEAELARGLDMQCEGCLLCGGAEVAGKDVAIFAHGAKSSHARVDPEDMPPAWTSAGSTPSSFAQSREKLAALGTLGLSMKDMPEEPFVFLYSRVKSYTDRLSKAAKDIDKGKVKTPLALSNKQEMADELLPWLEDGVQQLTAMIEENPRVVSNRQKGRKLEVTVRAILKTIRNTILAKGRAAYDKIMAAEFLESRKAYSDLHYVVEASLDRADVVISPALFAGKMEVDDSDPERPWAFLKVEQGIPKAAYEALQLAGIPCEARYDSPHITVVKNDEAKELKELHGDNWKDAILAGPDEYSFMIHEMIDLDPDGWDEMDRVWFLRCSAPGLVQKRVALDLTPFPTGEDGSEQEFHITCAVRSANGNGEETIEESTRRAIRSALFG